jgi:periplasmic protein TonB
MKRRSAGVLLAIAMWLVGPAVGAQPALGGSTSADEPAKTPVTRVQVSSAEMAKLLRSKVPPKYPQKARNNYVQGTVMLRALVSKEGDVTDAFVISGNPELGKAAVKAAKLWKYQPYLVQGQPVEVETTIQMNFVLSGS